MINSSPLLRCYPSKKAATLFQAPVLMNMDAYSTIHQFLYWHNGVSKEELYGEINFYARVAKQRADFMIWFLHYRPRRPHVAVELLHVSFTYVMCASLPNELNAATAPPHTHKTHISLISQETPLYLATADCELLSNAGFHWEVLWSHISIAVLSVAEVMKRSRRSHTAELWKSAMSLPFFIWQLFPAQKPARTWLLTLFILSQLLWLSWS